jgi:cobalt-zinc-cadmium efflux system protein
MPHDHGDHQHTRSGLAAGDETKGFRLKVVLVLNVAIIVAQAVFGITAHSLGLMADAGHNLTDAGGVFLSLLAVGWARTSATERRSYGMQRSTILAAQANAAMILIVTVVIFYEGIRRLLDPQPVHGDIVLGVAAFAFLANLVAALFLRGSGDDLNMRSALLHMAGDALASLGVVAAGAVIWLTGRFYELDPLVAMAIGLIIAWQAWHLLALANQVLLEGVPAGVNIAHVREHILGVDGVLGLHDLHVWTLTSGVDVMSAHVVVRQEIKPADVLDQLCSCLGDHFDIEHSTFQIEYLDRSEMERAIH